MIILSLEGIQLSLVQLVHTLLLLGQSLLEAHKIC